MQRRASAEAPAWEPSKASVSSWAATKGPSSASEYLGKNVAHVHSAMPTAALSRRMPLQSNSMFTMTICMGTPVCTLQTVLHHMAAPWRLNSLIPGWLPAP